MKLKVILTIILTIMFTNSSYPAYAHVLETDGTIGAVIHIDPADDPIAGEESGFYFELKDKTNKFTPEECDCTFVVLADGKEIYSQKLYSNTTDAIAQYTFPEKNIYTIRLSGEPREGDTFQAFTLNYQIRVERSNTEASNNQLKMPDSWLPGATLVLGIGVVVGIILKMKHTKHHKTRGGE